MKQRLALVLALSLTAGCVSVPRTEQDHSYTDRRDALQALEQWSLAGRIGVRLDDRGFTGALNWLQQQERLDVRVHGPLGAGAFRMYGDATALVVESGDGQTYELDDPETALAEILGWSVPVAAMRYWLLGIPYPAWPADADVGDDGLLRALTQRDWSLSYERYTLVDDWMMPRKLKVAGTDVTVRVSIHRWELDTAH